MTKEFKKITNKSETRYVLESMTAGATGSASIAAAPGALGKLQKRLQELKDKVPQKPRQGPMRPQTGAGVHKNKKKDQQRGLEKHKGQSVYQEEFNGEYDDEAGMAESNLHTLARAVKGLMDTIDSNDNLPEWCQEKIAKAEMMLVSVWDYLLSQKEQGIDPEQGVAEEHNDTFDPKSHQYKTTMKHADKPTIQQRMAAHDIKPGVAGYRDRIDMIRDLERTGKLKKDEGTNDSTQVLSDIVDNEDFDALYALMSSDTEAGKIVQRMYNDVSGEEGLHPDDDFEEILSIVLDRLTQDYGQQGVAESERTMSRAGKGVMKYGKDGMKALAKAGREGASEKKLDSIRDKYDNYTEGLRPGEYHIASVIFDNGTVKKIRVPSDNLPQSFFDRVKKNYEQQGLNVVDIKMDHGVHNSLAAEGGKKKGADGKACWKGYRYAGTKNGKDSCVKVGEDTYTEHLLSQLQEKFASQQQAKLMYAVAGDRDVAKKTGVSTATAREYIKKSHGQQVKDLPKKVKKK